MNWSGAIRLAVFVCTMFAVPSGVSGALQQDAPGQVLHILVNKSVVINVQAPVTRLLTSNPAAIEVVATTPTQVVVSGKAAGTSSLILWDAAENSQLLDVVVDLDITALKDAISRSYPNQQINVEAVGGRIVLSGVVPSQVVVDDLTKIAGAYSAQVINSLTVLRPRERQILLEVKFAEVDRSQISQLGINILSTGLGNTPGAISTQQFGAARLGGTGGGVDSSSTATSFSVPDLLNIFLFRPDLNLAVTIKALEQKSLLQVLAEPNLLAMSGQKASFLAGGEFPFPLVQGGANVGAVTIEFKPFGVKLDFTGTVDSDDIIRLQVAPEVSTLDFTNSVSISGFVVPAMSTRRAETLVELRNGQSFGIAGLIDHRAQTQMSKIPGIGDIPIIGRLFRSSSINRSNTELMVIVTPRIVDPLNLTAAPAQPQNPMPFLDTPDFDKAIK